LIVRSLYGIVAAALLAFQGVSCLPADLRPPPGSILLTVTSADEPSVTTADGWTIAVDRLLLGMGNSFINGCTAYSESGYLRLLDGRLPSDQKLVILFGLGQCNFSFNVTWPYDDAVLGEGVTEADRELMGGSDVVDPSRGRQGIAVDFAATATRDRETKRVHWMFHQITSYPRCRRAVSGVPSRAIELESEVSLAFHLLVRGTAMFANDADPDMAKLRFDPIAAADFDADDEITLDELGAISLDMARQYGPYSVLAGGGPVAHTLEDYLYIVLLRQLVDFREDIACDTVPGFTPSDGKGPPR
jgi:hypothetical protein